MKTTSCYVISIALLFAAAHSQAATYTMGYPPVGGATIAFTGNSIGPTGGTFSYTGFNSSSYQQLYWGVNFALNVAQSDVVSPGNMAFYSYNPSTGIIAFVSTQNWTFTNGATSSQVSTATQLIVQVQPFTGANAGFLSSGFLVGETTTKGAIGINTGAAGDPLFQVVSATPFQGTFEFQTWDGTGPNIGQGTDVADFYANNNGGSNTSVVNTSVDFEFWWSVQPTTAKTVQVGACKTSLQSYGSIQTALSAVPSGATVQVCPGTYAEQLTISAPVNLTGIANGTNQAVMLTVPHSGLMQSGTGPVTSAPIFAQVAVQDAGPVNITGFTIDGTTSNCPSGAIVGVVFLSTSVPSSGKLMNSVIRNIAGSCPPQAAAFYAENGSGTTSTLSVLGNSIHSINGQAIIFGPNQSGTISNNTVADSNGGIGFQQAGPNVSATGNRINGAQNGISLNSASGVVVQSNTIINSSSTAISLNDSSSGGGNNVTKNSINEGACGISKGNASSTDVFLPNTVLNMAATICQ
ncbi:MAG: right-handed parallel beta-helix repeat-containing protein [Candidatus Sulfotelmatobacter sp.]